MIIDFLLDVFEKNAKKDAFVYNDRVFSYNWLLEAIQDWSNKLESNKVAHNSVVALKSDFSPQSTAILLALIENRNIIVPLSPAVKSQEDEFLQIAQVEKCISLDDDGLPTFTDFNISPDHPILSELKKKGNPGLILFSSGSTGKSKASVHDFIPLLEKFKVRRNAWRTIAFLLFDHIGGINTLLYTLSNGGCLITVRKRNPDEVCRAIEEYKVELLPTSPTFINLILLSEAYKRYDLSSLKLVSYGTEMMPESTLKAFHRILPDVRLKQTYGLSELGILRSKSKSSDSLWVKVGGEDFETKVVDGILWIRAKSAMLGYLNAPNPFDEEGWFNTGDAVEVDGEYIKFLGRKSEIINVGGEKVYPAEVEGVIQMMNNVKEAIVYGESNPITGEIVVVKVGLKEDEDRKQFISKLKHFCRERLPRYKVPVKVIISRESQHSDRFKKMRR